ncbi:MAG: hypothetical protein M3005_02650 [Apilactobacillus sp.]|uniref:hypothetical protein n=1 Tax=Apilactobacillus TaxID=2767877 RepID=UPI0025E4BD9F|nr:hypothetical protein [Apilactobacillus sp.]MCT6822752.1 hypothetical protein [Apilactobacillus sp.]MCT6858210.1 hypothetical protein [Apilactobacillus sp.]
MKAWKKILPAIAVLGLVLTACGQKNSDQASSSSSSEQSSKVNSSSSDKISNKLGDEKLPQNNGIDENKSVDTKVDGDKDNFTISYISNGKTYATYTKHTYGSDSAAMQQVGYESSNNVTGLPKVDLGSNITGYSDRGAGQEYIQANFGNWSLLTHGSNFGKTEGLATKQGKDVVAFIQNYQLPIPNKYGSISVNIDNTATITWQNGNDVYSVKANTVDIALKMATSLK